MMRRDLARVGVLWVVLTVLGELLVLNWRIFPVPYAREAEVVDEAFDLLSIMAVPVFAFVFAVLVYAIFAFRSSGPHEDGPPLRGTGKTIGAWLVITVALALAILINPGFVGLAEVRGESTPDLVIDVTGQRWFWTVTYPNGAEVTSVDGELVVPVDTRIRFDITAPAADVVHSFWVPAFRVKKDAVPGRVTRMLVTPLETGSYEDDPNLRVQCAELCGLGHAGMMMKVRVVEPDEFDAYLANLARGG